MIHIWVSNYWPQAACILPTHRFCYILFGMALDCVRERKGLVRLSTLARGYYVICNNTVVSVQDWKIKTGAAIHQLNSTSSSGWGILNTSPFLKKFNHEAACFFCWGYSPGKSVIILCSIIFFLPQTFIRQIPAKSVFPTTSAYHALKQCAEVPWNKEGMVSIIFQREE